MANEAYIDLAVEKLHAYFSNNINTALRAVELEQSLTPYSLPDPHVIKHRAPFDNRSPLVQIYENTWRQKAASEKLWEVDCTILLSYASGPDLDAGEKLVRRYVTAMTRVLLNSTLGDNVTMARIKDAEADASIGDKSQTRMLRAFGVDVDVYCPV